MHIRICPSEYNIKDGNVHMIVNHKQPKRRGKEGEMLPVIYFKVMEALHKIDENISG